MENLARLVICIRVIVIRILYTTSKEKQILVSFRYSNYFFLSRRFLKTPVELKLAV